MTRHQSPMIARASPGAALPLYASRFVGRRADLDALHRHLGVGHHLVTVVGTAGVGKTRLAVEFVTSEGRGRSPGGMAVAFCSLASARSLDDVHQAVASTLRVPPNASSDVAGVGTQIGAWLSRRGPLILVLDNFEQVCAEGAAAVAAWHAQAPDVMFLVTARAALGVPDEHCVSVEPLEVAAQGLEARADAVELFLTHASAVLGRAVGGADEIALVASTVRQLEGIPLALELAAARLEVLTLPDLHARLAARFRVLRDPSAVPDERHASLWHAIDWSWNLLSPAAQQTLMQASVFAGGFTLEAAEAVIRTGTGSGGDGVVEAVRGLCRNSLLRTTQDGDDPEAFRVVWYESVREYAAERLEAVGATEATRSRHAAYFLEQGVAWARGVDGHGGTALLAKLAREHDNLTAVLQRSIALADRALGADRAMRALYALGQVLAARGSPATHLRVIESVFAAAEGTPAAMSVWAARALHARARANRVLGNLDACMWDVARALAITTRCGETRYEGHLRAYLGGMCELQGLAEAAREQTEMAIEIARRCDDPFGEGTARLYRGTQWMSRDQLAPAKVALGEALRLLRVAGHREFEELALATLGVLHVDEDQLAEARACLLAALEISCERGMRRREAIVVGYLAWLSHAEGQLDEAHALFERTLAILADLGDRAYAAANRTFLGVVDVERGHLEVAERALREAVETLSDIPLASMRDGRILGGALVALATARARQGDVDEAEALARRCETLLVDGPEGGAPVSLFEVLRAGIDLARAEIALARATQTVREGQRASGEGYATRARELIAAHQDTTVSDQRIALRMVRAVLAAWEATASAWTIERQGRWFAAPSRPPVSVAPRLAAILAALVQQRVENGLAGLGVPELSHAAWPGTRLVPASAANRVRVAISGLRKLGLTSVVQLYARGYRLDPEVAVQIVDGDPQADTDGREPGSRSLRR